MVIYDFLNTIITHLLQSHIRQKVGANVNIRTVSISYEFRDVITYFISEFFLISQSFLIVGGPEIITVLTHFNLQILSL